MLRNLLVQDWDLDDDGEPESLRLLFGTARRWLDDGQCIIVERVPSAFGPVSVRAESRLADGQVLVQADLPTRHPPQRTLLRARVPASWRVTAARIGDQSLPVDDRGTVDLSQQSGSVLVQYSVCRP
jgi:hypothetical protein